MTDTRPRYTYILPDGTEVQVIHDHGETPKRESTFTLASGEVVPMWLKLTAETVTDEEIRALLEADDPPVTSSCRYLCRIASGDLRGGRMGSSRAEEHQARARVAEIINARRAQGGK